MTLLTILAVVFSGIAALSNLDKVLQWGWRWRFGGWALGVYSIWFWTYHVRSYSSNPRLHKLLRRIHKTRMQPIGFLSRLARSDLTKRVIIGLYSSPSDWLEEPSEGEVNALARARRIMLQRDAERLERLRKRTHKRISCSICGDTPKRINHLFCSQECCTVDDPHQVPHFCFTHRRNSVVLSVIDEVTTETAITC